MAIYWQRLSLLLIWAACTAVTSFSPISKNHFRAKIHPGSVPSCPPNSRAICHVFKSRQIKDVPFVENKTHNDQLVIQEQGMGDLVQFLQKSEESSPSEQALKKQDFDAQPLLLGAGALFATSVVGILASLGLTVQDVVHGFQNLLANPQDTLQNVIDYVQAMGPSGVLYFGLIYLAAEILAVPATPLTLSAGALFGLTKGVAVVLLAATIAACVGFVVGKTLLRSWVEDVLEEKPEFAKIDKAIGKEGFKLLLLVRLSPIFPFALSNYLYGASSIDFASYLFGTLLGFTPGTIAYVYTGMVGAELTVGDGSQPWYIYAAGLGALVTFLKLVTDVATEIVNAVDDDDDSK